MEGTEPSGSSKRTESSQQLLAGADGGPTEGLLELEIGGLCALCRDRFNIPQDTLTLVIRQAFSADSDGCDVVLTDLWGQSGAPELAY